MSLPSLSEIYARWHNANHGFEKNPDVNYSRGFNDTGMLDHCIFIFVLKTRGSHRPEVFNIIYHDINRLASEKTGVFFTNIYDKFENIKKIKHNRVENYIGMSLASIMGLYFSVPRNISFRIKKSLGVFSFYGRLKLIPFSIPDIAMLLYCSGDIFLAKMLYPFLISTSIFYLSFKNKFIEKKIIYLMFLYNLRHKNELGFLYNFYLRKLISMYGENFLHELMKKYYENKEHPSILYSKNVTFKEVITWKPK